MTTKKTFFLGGSILIILILSCFLLFSPLGVHTYGEILFPEKEYKVYESHNYPTAIDEMKPIGQIFDLPSTLKQPSGVDFNEDKKTFLVVTDQAEIMELTNEFKEINSSATISNKPLLFRQGSVESIDFYENKAYIGGDLGKIELWEEQSGVWKRTGSITPRERTDVNYSAEALAIHPETGDIYLGNNDKITIIDQQGNYVSEIALKGEVKDGRSISEYIIAGLDFHKNTLYVLTEYHSAILSVDYSTGIITEIYGLEGMVEGAGLAVTDSAYFVVVDHELDEVSPGVKMYKR
ncbi:MAG: hypothetical protein AAF039_02240 [Bacteroidota bacterium]